MLSRRIARRRGQTIVFLALALGMILAAGALVIDNGTKHRVRAQTQHAADAAALAGMAEFAATRDGTAARDKALEVLAENGYQSGQRGVVGIELWAYDADNYNATTSLPKDPLTGNRYSCKIFRELPQNIAATFGVRRTQVEGFAVAALIGAVPIDIDFETNMGFPDKANLAQFGPDAPYTFGDAYSTRMLNDGSPNPLYNPSGYRFDMFVPDDLEASTGSSFVRVEIFDADTINRGPHVVKNPSRLQDTDGDPTEPEVGGLDEIRATAAAGGDVATSPQQFSGRSTQTEWQILDADNVVVATASYGPLSNTPFWFHDEAPAAGPPRTAQAFHAESWRRQIGLDLKWITPEGFEFDISNYRLPFRVMVRTVHGSSENGYSMRVSAQRPDGEKYDPMTYGTTDTAALAMYGYGRVPINFPATDVTQIPIGSVPSAASDIVITNYDTDIGSQYSKFTMTGYDATTGQGDYPVLFPAPPSATGANVVRDTSGNKYYTYLNGHLSANGQWETDHVDIPEEVVIPQTNGSGALVFNPQGRITIVDQRDFEGAELRITYSAGAHDTSVWEVSFSGDAGTGDQQILLIR